MRGRQLVWGWGCSSVGSVLTWHAHGPRFRFQCLIKLEWCIPAAAGRSRRSKCSTTSLVMSVPFHLCLHSKSKAISKYMRLCLKSRGRAERRLSGLEALAARAQDPSSVPSTHAGSLKPPLTPVSGDPTTSSGLYGSLHS